MRALSTLLCGVVVVAWACAPGKAEDRLLERITALRADGRLPSSGVDPARDPVAVRAFFARFEELHAGLRERPPARDDRAALAAFHAEAAALVDLEVCREALRRGESLARPLLRIPAPPEGTLVDTPGLVEVREWTELLCARALLEAGESEGGPAAIASLTTLLELLFVWNDHSLIGEVICSSQERRVLETLEALAPLPSVDARALRDAVDPYLFTRSHATLVTTVTIETDFWIRAVESLIVNDAPITPLDMDLLGFSGSSFPDASHDLLDRFEQILELRGDVCHARLGNSDEESTDGPRLLYAVREWHDRNIRLALARIALAVVARREEHGTWPQELDAVAGSFADGLPAHPCGHLRFDYARTDGGFRLTSVDRRRPEADVVRAAWSWPLGVTHH